MPQGTPGDPPAKGASARGPGPPNLLALTASLPLFAYHVAFVSPTFAEFLAIVTLMVAFALVLPDIVMTRRVDVGYILPLLFALFCEGFAPYSETPLFWILTGTGTLLALVGQSLRGHSEGLIPSNLGVTLQVATLPAIYYSVVSGFPLGSSLACVMLVILALALLYNLFAVERSPAVWLLCSAEILVVVSLLLGVMSPLRERAVVVVMTNLPPLLYLLALHVAFADGARLSGSNHST